VPKRQHNNVFYIQYLNSKLPIKCIQFKILYLKK